MIAKLQPIVKAHMSPYRYDHCMRVAETAKWLAGYHGIDQTKSEIAGLVHDIAKEKAPKDAAALQIQLPPESDEIYTTYPTVWHAIVAPEFIRAICHIEDPDILSAAKWHTTGKARMTPLEQILYVADFIEPERTVAGLRSLAEIAKKDLNSATAKIARETIRHLRQ